MANITMNNNVSPFKKAVATILFWWGLIITSLGFLGIIINVFGDTTDTEEQNLFEAILGLLIFGGLPLIAGYIMKKNIKTKSLQDAYNKLERNVLGAAKKHEGVLTLSDASYEMKTNLDETKELMNIFVRKNLAEITVDDVGKIIYIFHDFVKNND